MWINKFTGILAINQKSAKDITEGILYSLQDCCFLFRFPVHYSAAMTKFYSENRNVLILLDWSRCFGDVMPVEWLWKVMLNELNENQIKVFSEQRLWE